MPDPIEIRLDNKEITDKLLELANRDENLRPLMKNIAGIFAYSTEENFKAEGRPKWQDLAETTKKQRAKKGKYPGQILQVEGKLAASVSTYYDDDSAVIGSNLPYAAVHQLGGKAGKGRKVTIPARPYLKLTEADCQEILNETLEYLQ
jgi:phage virion morphogenesis protein